jgi:hypothetical protein
VVLTGAVAGFAAVIAAACQCTVRGVEYCMHRYVGAGGVAVETTSLILIRLQLYRIGEQA